MSLAGLRDSSGEDRQPALERTDSTEEGKGKEGGWEERDSVIVTQ